MSGEKNNRIAKNTIYLYLRMIFTMLVSLYTSRVVLSALGVSDYGVYNVVGGVVVMFSFLSGAMSNGTQRFLAYELGNGNMLQLKKVFSTILSIHILIGIIIFVFAEIFGLWFLNNKLNIPLDRVVAANWVYQFSILTFFVSVIQVPYNASIISHERMDMFAYMSIFEILLKLLIVVLLSWSNYDKLILYGFLYFISTFIIAYVYRFYCKINFSECKYYFVFDKKLFKSLLSFAGWNLYGNAACVIADQGVNLIINIFFGPLINAARGISYQVNSIIRSFANNFQMAANPQIIKSHASGESEYMMNLIFKTSKFSFYLLFIIALPIFIEIDFILNIWLKVVPANTSFFIRLIIINGLIDVFSGALQTGANASGNIKLYQFSEGTIILSVLPITYILYKSGYGPEFTFYVGIVVAICLQFTRLYILSNLINLNMKSFVLNIFFKSIFVGFLSALIPFLVSNLIYNEIIRFFIVCLSCVFSSFIIIYILGLEINEKIFVKEKITQTYFKLRAKLFN